MLAPNQLKIVWDAYNEYRRKGMSPAEAWKAASTEYEGLKAEYRAQGKQKPEPPAPAPDDELLDELLDPHRRPALLARRPDLAQRLSEGVGPRAGWPRARRDDVASWDMAIVNTWTLAERLDDGDPRRELVEKAQQLADTTGIDFLLAVERIKVSSPALVERIATYNTMIS